MAKAVRTKPYILVARGLVIGSLFDTTAAALQMPGSGGSGTASVRKALCLSLFHLSELPSVTAQTIPVLCPSRVAGCVHFCDSRGSTFCHGTPPEELTVPGRSGDRGAGGTQQRPSLVDALEAERRKQVARTERSRRRTLSIVSPKGSESSLAEHPPPAYRHLIIAWGLHDNARSWAILVPGGSSAGLAGASGSRRLLDSSRKGFLWLIQQLVRRRHGSGAAGSG